MDFFSFLALFGGLAVFLYGMTVMGEGLERSAGNRLKGFLESATKSPLRAVILGAGVTAIIQSSSATTVMVVGFVNSGVMALSQSIGIIMGANIGTTVTAWILSLSGLRGDSFITQLLNADNISLLVAVIGILLVMASKNSKYRDIGSVLLGFTILMLGMSTMSSAVEPLAEIPAFTSILTLFSNPLLGVLMGAVLTAIIQSSSASVGILQALAATGSVSYASAIPIIMGQNIGTCITAILSSIGANKDAKRAAVVHLCFNIIGTIAFFTVYYLIRLLIGLPFIGEPISAAGIAVVHTTFNVFSTMIMLPFIKQLERLAYVIIKPEGKAEKTALLDERLLLTPAVAVGQCKALTDKMAEMAKDSLCRALSLVRTFDKSAAEQIRRDEDTVDFYEDQLGSYLVKLSGKSLAVEDSRAVSNLLHSIGDFERISDHAVNLLETAEEVYQKKAVFSESAQREMAVLSEAVCEILEHTVQAFEQNDLELAKQIEPLEQVIDQIRFKLKNRHIQRLRNGECTIETGFIFSDFLANCERVADHCSNIAVCLIQVAEDRFETHEYLSNVKSHGEPGFDEQYQAYKAKYTV